MADRILVIDDEPGVRAALEGILEDEGFEVRTAESGEDGLAALETESFDAVLLDIWLPGIDGLETLIRMRDRRIDSEVVMISGHGTIETAVRATKLGAFDFVEKPLSLEKTLLVMRNALRQRRLERRNRRLLEQLSRDTEILGTSAAAERLRSEVSAAASSEAPVLICGERGTGRETVARRIHGTSRRSEEAFVGVPCAALDDRGAEEALFGEPGGRLRLAAGGTVFLDDAQALAPELQERLAGLLETRREGSPDVRVIASTGPDPGSLTSPLRERLEVIRIDIPALRGRREDIPLFIERFVRELSREYGRPEKRISPECMATLVAYEWPGNVRELRNLAERLILMSGGDVVRVEDLPEDLGGAERPTEDLYREFGSLAEGLASFERYYIRRLLTEERDEASAAKRLGLTTQALKNRMNVLGLS
jgi:two-component system nitrogen regulation response regulator NtrX